MRLQSDQDRGEVYEVGTRLRSISDGFLSPSPGCCEGAKPLVQTLVQCGTNPPLGKINFSNLNKQLSAPFFSDVSDL